MNNTINARIRKVREHFCGGNNKEFAGRLKKEPNTTSNWVGDGYTVGKGVASEIAAEFGVSMAWLLTGEGEMLKQRSKTATQLELDFSSIVESNAKLADAVHIMAKNNATTSETNAKMYEDNRTLIAKAIGLLERIEVAMGNGANTDKQYLVARGAAAR